MQTNIITAYGNVARSLLPFHGFIQLSKRRGPEVETLRPPAEFAACRFTNEVRTADVLLCKLTCNAERREGRGRERRLRF